MKRLPTLLIAIVATMLATLVASPGQALVSNHDVPKAYEIGKVFPGLAKTTRMLDEERRFTVPGVWCAGEKEFKAKSAMSVLYGPRYFADFETWGTVSRPLLSVSAYEFSTTKQASAVISSLRAHAKKCTSYRAEGVYVRTGYLKVGRIGDERISMRMQAGGQDFGGFLTYTGVRQGRVVSIVVTSAEDKISQDRLTRLTRLAVAKAK
ncbi:hypothetical protein BJ980_002865 [Nocardioides daedukensis]|uniref:Sensor domain-containing protein n=1 Tax=Nocardioides daedukensis TaxID=634462 RepID=A0A7Y9S3M1_9ACTN|nr:hypothetical protein [Nocardioides daedukensis]NYG59942.1 hypothetical protein [Nocardioides daedukensis]